MQLQDLEKSQSAKGELNWVTAIFMAAFHIGAIAALFFFTWKALFVAIFLWWVAGSLGIGMAYHRLLTHRGFKTPKWVEYFLTVCATLALEGGPIFWVATHRIHHLLLLKSHGSDYTNRAGPVTRGEKLSSHSPQPLGAG